MNTKHLFIISMTLNIFILIGISYKANIKMPEYISKLDETILESKVILRNNSRTNNDYLRRRLDRIPKIKEGITNAISSIRESGLSTEKTLVNINNRAFDFSGKDSTKLEKRIEINSYYNNEKRVDTIRQTLNSAIDSINYHYKAAILETQKEKNLIIAENFMDELEKNIPKINIEDRMNALKHSSWKESELILNSLILDIENLVYSYTSSIKKMIPENNIKYNKVKLGIQSEQKTIKEGDTFKVKIGLMTYTDQLDSKSYLEINGTKYHFDENGKIKYSEWPKKKGKNEIKLKAAIVNPLSGETMTAKSSFEYKHID